MFHHKKNVYIIFFRSLQLCFAAAPITFFIVIFFVIIDSIIPVLLIISSKYIIDILSALFQNNTVDISQLIFWIIFWMILIFMNKIIAIINNIFFGNLSDSVTRLINLMIIDKASNIKDLYDFENSDFHDDLHILQNQATSNPVKLIGNIALNLKNIITIIGMLIIMGGVHILIPIIFIAFSIPEYIQNIKLNKQQWNTWLYTSKYARRAKYFSSIVLDQSTIKESMLYGMGSFSKEHYKKNFDTMWNENKKIRKKKLLLSVPTTMLSIFGNIIIFSFVIYRIYGNFSSIGVLVMFLQAFFQIQYHINDLIQFGGHLQTILLFFQKLFSFLNWENNINIKTPSLAVHKNPRHAPLFVFQNVSFMYPNNETYSIKNISFEIDEKKNTALVGENGSGKTTIIKLLLRFYTPQEGTIFYKGTPIDTIPIDEYRSMIACVFQDFSKYYIPLYENIFIAHKNRAYNPEKIQALLKQLSFSNDTYIENISLGKIFGGKELSGGQWQKIAIARALYRDAPIVILDEPTASLDPISEYKIFENFTHITKGKTSIMITHRLGSAKNADTIIVLEQGKIIEHGSHKTLMGGKGLYRKMFETQNNQYLN